MGEAAFLVNKPKAPVVIQSIRVDTQGVEYPAPKKR